MLDILAAAGIACGPGHSVRQLQTILKTRVIARTQQLCRFDREDAPADYAIDQAPGFAASLDTLTRDVDAVIVSDYAKGTITQPTLDALRESCRRHGKWFVIDPKPGRLLDLSGATCSSRTGRKRSRWPNCPRRTPANHSRWRKSSAASASASRPRF